MTQEDIYKMARVLSRDTSPSSKRLPKYPPYQQYSYPYLPIFAYKLGPPLRRIFS